MLSEDKYLLLMPFMQQLHGIRVLSADLESRITNEFQVAACRKKQTLLNIGETANHIHVVLKGLARTFSIFNRKEVSTRFIAEGALITCPISFFTRNAGDESIELLEDSIIASMDYITVEKIYSDFEEFNYNVRKLVESYLVLSEKRTQLLRIALPSDRFRFFAKMQGDLIGRVSDEHLASFLAMGRSTFNKVKKKYLAELHNS